MGQKSMETRGKSAFFRPSFLGISSFFSLIYLVFLSIKFSVFSPSVTLVTAKNQHRCWKARALHVRTKRLNEIILQSWYINFCVSKNKMLLFRDFFPLWVRIDPYTYRGASLKSASHYDSTFTAKAKLIYQSLWLHIPLSFVGQWLDGTATRRFWNSLKTVKRLWPIAEDYWHIATCYGATSSICCANPWAAM